MKPRLKGTEVSKVKSGNAVGDGQKETDGLVTVVRLKMWSIKPWGVPQERLSCKIPRIGGERERERDGSHSCNRSDQTSAEC